jgi:hypothetical protein
MMPVVRRRLCRRAGHWSLGLFRGFACGSFVGGLRGVSYTALRGVAVQLEAMRIACEG